MPYSYYTDPNVSYTVHVMKGFRATDVAINVDREVRKLLDPTPRQVLAAIQYACGVSYVSRAPGCSGTMSLP